MKIKFILFFFIFFIISQIYYAFDLNVTIIDNNSDYIEDVRVIVEDTIKTTDSSGKASFSDLNRYIDIKLSKDGYKERYLKTDLNKNKNLSIFLDRKESNFFFSLKKAADYGHSFSTEELGEYDDLSNAVVNFYKDDKLITSIDYTGEKSELNLADGSYDIEIFTLSTPPYILKNIEINREKYNYLNVTMVIGQSKVEGRVVNNNSYLGGVKLIFKDNINKTYTFTSDLDGSFEGYLPPNIYELSVEKNGYQLGSSNIFDFSNTQLTYKPIIELVEEPSYIEGYVFDTEGKALANSKLEIKNNGMEKIIYTDMNGRYFTRVEKGLVFIKANKNGFYPSGKIERVEAFSTKRIDNIVIQEKLSALYGNVTNGISPVMGVRVKLYEKNGTFVASSKTDINGYFAIENIKITEEYYLAIDNPMYLSYKSQLFSNEEKERKNINIILNDNNINFVVELTSPGKDKTLDNVEVIVNDNKFRTDLNGIVNETVYSDEKVEALNIKVPTYNFNRVYRIEDLGKEPYLIKVEVNNNL